MSIQVMLVDDHKLLREGIKQLLEFDNSIHVIDEASCAIECLEKVKANRADVILLDINLPDLSGLDVLREIKRKSKSVKVLILTVHNEVEYIIEAMDNGVDGYILKESGSTELIKAIKSVYQGTRYIQSELIPLVNARLVKKDVDKEKIEEITKREREVLKKIAEGKSNKEIAIELKISERTVKNHISNLFKKIDVADRTQAAVFAIKNNIVRV